MGSVRAIALTFLLLLGPFCAAEPTTFSQQTLVASCDPPPDPPNPPKKGKNYWISFKG